ncbi:tRNA (adenosine(37)-N6)-threonylcarbamoyltransferase complex dimerization subunit type 1 TsaB [Microbulbifer hydrolyticus]|uniref:tRNA threonylcarbamoyladenosine biosynthesis protein TsaB n=1 Tax=Microbulbifer hydrolyticus TaxID=48074 RepID=A0A6P1TD34_9GAMM|nr:tRNA (adenosine(37)-N6)-threonylcarbamoyltransferase complex dimerization subunit type 1 TsaB [Microbulbifer hydrolyticus]MBB5210004.1 tRNA threonylcarbamoyladenosine biosynthesis protein TsaB [Microbulbifer hydrolyticus]QHQ39470.1 tRNA (adenosine(37)-N6)-threonylcarbamoyltransferase complex dimerization subunit type 1 TsaB [Microbulbifer hydrolyticus]
MKLLAVDTTSGACSVALYQESHHNGRKDCQVIEQFVRAERDHTRRLLPMVESVLAQAQCSLAEVDALAVSQGPGSFTGLRIAISCVQGLAFAIDKPVVPVSSLAAMACGAVRTNPDWTDAPILPALDARMQEVYWGLYSSERPGQALLPDAVAGPEQVISALEEGGFLPAEGGECPFYAAGPGWQYPQLAALAPRSIWTEAAIHAQDIAVLAADRWNNGEFLAAQDLEPAYLRNEVTWKKRERIRNR